MKMTYETPHLQSDRDAEINFMRSRHHMFTSVMQRNHRQGTMLELQGKLLIVDDKPLVGRALQGALRVLGFEVVTMTNAEEAIQTVKRTHYDAVLFDISMPDIAWMAACLELRRLRPQLGILILTTHDDSEMKIESLDAGADDYVTKPCHMGELAARLRSLIRRLRSGENRTGPIMKIGEIELDSARRTVHRTTQLLHLTPKEFELLYYLMSNAGFPVTHAQLLGAVWGPEHVQQVEYLRTFVRQLRNKLGDSAAHPHYLLTETQIGYRFRGADETVDQNAEPPFIDQNRD
jgi:two-component system, OmpR family, KDP operon response regulator KdpE